MSVTDPAAAADQGGVHIASMVLWSRPQGRPVAQLLADCPWAQLPFPSEGGKSVVVIEAPDQGTLWQYMEQLRGLSGVLDAQLVYHHIDGDPPSP